MFGPVVLLGVGLGGATILGIPWSAHAFFTGMILLAVVLAIGPRWNDLIAGLAWQLPAMPRGAMWQPGLPLERAIRRQALRGARASVLAGLLAMAVLTIALPRRPSDPSVSVFWFMLAGSRFPLATAPAQRLGSRLT